MTAFDETFDFVVVGSGGGSMCAALMMRTAGKSVTVLEKTDLIGGTTARSGGVMWIPDNPFMKRDGVPDSLEAAVTYLDHAVGDHNDTPGATRERRRTYVSEAPKMLDFLIGQGIEFDRIARWPDYYDELPGSSKAGRTVVANLFDINELGESKAFLRPNFLNLPATLEEAMKLPNIKKSWASRKALLSVGLRGLGAKLRGKRYVTAGAALQGRMLQAALKAGVKFRVNTPVRELIIEDGAVTGVLAQKDGRPVRIGARLGVLVNAGGFAKNQAMRDTYQPGTVAKWSGAIEGDTGEMIQEMMRHGAAIAQMDEVIGSPLAVGPGMEDAPLKPGMQGLTAAPHAIMVDQSGVRYMNEGGSYTAFCKNMFERNREVPAIPSWAIFDSQCVRDTMIVGTMPGSKKPESWFKEGFIKKGETIEELARALGIEPATLRATVDRFNTFVTDGHDADFKRGDRAYDRWLGNSFHRPNETLGEISVGPFYALPVLPGDVSTFGGVVTDIHAQVLREDSSPIGGLYATGVSTASVMGRVSPGSGVSVGASFVWGYVAAQHALAAPAPEPAMQH